MNIDKKDSYYCVNYFLESVLQLTLLFRNQ